MRRILLAFAISVAVHVLVVAAGFGVGILRGLSLVPNLRVQSVSVDVKDFPLGAPPAKSADPGVAPPLSARKPARVRAAVSRDGVTIPASPDAGAPDDHGDAALSPRGLDGGGSMDGGRRRPGDLRENGPEGSRVIALLRLDRLRTSKDSDKTTAALDQLFLLLPDRRRLIEGTGLDLYRDFDGLLVATPNPLDDAVTFLAARHHLSDAAIKAGLERGAKAAGKPIAWRQIAGRPVGIRTRAPGENPASLDRDDRILALPATSLAVMATPAYAEHILGAKATLSASRAVDGGAPDAKSSSPAKSSGPVNWRELVERIDAEDSALPDDAAFMMTAANLFAQPPAGASAVPPGRGSADDAPLRPLLRDGIVAPRALTLLVGVETPYLDIRAEFADAGDAERWERDLPVWRRRLQSNPLVMLSGFSSLVGRAEFSREANTVQVHATTSVEELQRLLNVIANLTRTALARPR